MQTIKGIDQLLGIISQDQMDKLEKAAKRQLEQKNISYTILSFGESEVKVAVEQSENRSGKYASVATLEKNAQEVFKKQLPNMELNIVANPFLPSPVNTVDPKWLENKMEEKGVRIKQIAFDTGIDRETIADWVTGKRQMSQLVKAMLFFYLK